MSRRTSTLRFAKWLIPLSLTTFSVAVLLNAQQAPTSANNINVKDPGVRGGAAGAGGAIAGLKPPEATLFTDGQGRFTEVDSVSGTLPGESGSGLGPSFNMNSCAGCHAFPATGGTSPFSNPQVTIAMLHGANNVVPPFITSNGPVREARFVRNPDGSPDGGVHDLFTIAGRTDAAGCTLQQTNFGPQLSAGNVIFRIPTPVFGAGLIEAIEDATILANKTASSQLKAQLGISGHENRIGNDGTITRFGWKAQNKSLLIFAGEAYNVEQGVTNEAFPNPRQTAPGCDANPHPEDNTPTGDGFISDLTGFGLFMQMLAPPAPVNSFGNVSDASIDHGQQVFSQVGCALCHTPSLRTGPAAIAALSNQTANLYSDLLVHNMGQLADGVSQGNAAGDEFRSAPLWGLGKRIFLLHDGRTTDLLQAILAHSSSGSEANQVINLFNQLPSSSKQDLLNFLRSL